MERLILVGEAKKGLQYSASPLNVANAIAPGDPHKPEVILLS